MIVAHHIRRNSSPHRDERRRVPTQRSVPLSNLAAPVRPLPRPVPNTQGVVIPASHNDRNPIRNFEPLPGTRQTNPHSLQRAASSK
jgi:hypothetical protein